MTRRTLVLLCVILWLVLPAAGCGPSGPKLNPATGTVTYQGKAVEGAAVGFRSEEAKATATGMTDAQGRFKLSTLQAGEGAPAGKYKVTVTKFTSSGASSGPVSMEEAAKKGSRPAAKGPENQLPAKYADPATSSLEYTISPGGPNDFKINLSN